MNYKELLKKREELRLQVEALKMKRDAKEKSDEGMRINKEIAKLKEKYQFYNALLKVQEKMKKMENEK